MVGILSITSIVFYFIIKRVVNGDLIFRYRLQDKIFSFAFLLYIVSVAISLILTSLRHPSLLQIAVMYAALHILWIWALWFLRYNGAVSPQQFKYVVACVLLWLVLGGILELVGVLPVPVRPTYEGFLRLVGTTGAMQHFSFGLAVSSLLAYWVAEMDRSLFFRVAAWIGISLTFISLTRNGIFVIVLTLLIYYFSSFRKLLTRGFSIMILTGLLLGTILHYMPDFGEIMIDRVATMTTPSAPGNPGRIEAWIRGLEAWMQGPILVGESVGRYSQAGTRLGLVESVHFESAILQQLGNFGVVGLFSFVMCFICVILTIEDRFLRGLSLIMFTVFGFYPGSESLPFISSWFLVAMAAATEKRSARCPLQERV